MNFTKKAVLDRLAAIESSVEGLRSVIEAGGLDEILDATQDLLDDAGDGLADDVREYLVTLR